MKDIIVIDRDAIGTTDLPNWFTNNKKYIKDPVPANHTQLAPEIEIDLKKFLILKGPSNWCVKNRDYIIYNKSRETIEYLHTIDIAGDYDDEIRALIATGAFHSLSLSDLQNKGYVFNVDKYQVNYMILEMDTSNKLKDAQFGAYDRTKSCYSHPFFKSIIDNNINKGNTSNWKFTFVKIKIDGLDTVAFLVEFNDANSTITYYDYSNIPPAAFISLKGLKNDPISISGGNAFQIRHSLEKARIF